MACVSKPCPWVGMAVAQIGEEMIAASPAAIKVIVGADHGFSHIVLIRGPRILSSFRR